jgi:hypothetical protein
MSLVAPIPILERHKDILVIFHIILRSDSYVFDTGSRFSIENGSLCASECSIEITSNSYSTAFVHEFVLRVVRIQFQSIL